MEVLSPCVAGLEVHQSVIVACRRRLLGESQAETEVEKFGTATRELKRLGEWLAAWDVQQVALESTGVLWHPVWNVLCESFELKLVNAQHLKKVPGRKSDVTDAEWLAQCLPLGLLRGSFVPSTQVREWRDLTRQRTKLLDQRTSVVNRIHKTLEGCHIKLGAAISDLFGASGRAMLKALSDGEADAERLAALSTGRLQVSHEELVASLEGHGSEHQQWVLQHLLKQVQSGKTTGTVGLPGRTEPVAGRGVKTRATRSIQPVTGRFLADAGQVVPKPVSFGGWAYEEEELANAQQPGNALPPGFRTVFLEGESRSFDFVRLSRGSGGKFTDWRASLGVELRMQVPILNVPFRLIFAINPNAQTDPTDPCVLFLERRRVICSGIGRTF
jgi:hypothetical protein